MSEVRQRRHRRRDEQNRTTGAEGQMSSSQQSNENAEEKTITDGDEAAREAKADLLMKKYTLLKQEVFLLIGSYRSHVRNLQIFLTFAAGLVGFFLSKDSYPAVINSWMLWAAMSVFLSSLVGYMAFDILEAQYHMIAIAARMTSLEKLINRLSGENVLL
jgi:hypothetical protein